MKRLLTFIRTSDGHPTEYGGLDGRAHDTDRSTKDEAEIASSLTAAVAVLHLLITITT